MLRGLLSQKNPSQSIADYGITAINHPVPKSEIQLDSELENRIAMELFTAICVIFALAFIPASFLVFVIDERVTTSKHLQFVSGVKGKDCCFELTQTFVDLSLCVRADLLVVEFCVGSHELLRFDHALYHYLRCFWCRVICLSNESSLPCGFIISLRLCYDTVDVSYQLPVQISIHWFRPRLVYQHIHWLDHHDRDDHPGELRR